MCSPSTGICDHCGGESACGNDPFKPKCIKSDLPELADSGDASAKCGVRKNIVCIINSIICLIYIPVVLQMICMLPFYIVLSE